jgi:hypothetical protein
MYNGKNPGIIIQENSFISFIRQINSLLSNKIKERNRKGVKQNEKKVVIRAVR